VPSLQSEKIFAAIGPEKELAVEFFAVFSRFEYALKRAQCLKPGQNVSADWDKFVEKRLKLDPDIVATIIKNADYLLKKPPKKQICKGKKIGWELPNKRPKPFDSDIYWIFDLIRIVRNNLFHGGKYPDNEWPIDPVRDTQLVKSSLAVLKACLKLEGDVKTYFYEGLGDI
jgi:hypothetical protein